MPLNNQQKTWYSLSREQIEKALYTDFDKGLLFEDAVNRQEHFGPNIIEKEKETGFWQLVLYQFTDLMVLVLLGAVLISALLGAWDDALAIISIVILNAVMGIIQEHRAEKSLQALKKLSAPRAEVIRNGKKRKISASKITPGDILVLNTGDRISADARIIDSMNLKTNESLLTGESKYIEKDSEPLPKKKNIGVSDQKNMVFMGTSITQGYGRAVVVRTGMSTEMGKIAKLLKDTERKKTPLQKKLSHVGKWLISAALATCGFIILAGISRGESAYNMFLAGVSLAVAAIPEGLPAIVTISLALGVQRMIRQNAIIRKLPAVETLGCSTLVCSDKTGTLTQNKMTVRNIVLADGKEVKTDLKINKEKNDFQIEKSNKDLDMALKIAVLCNNARLVYENNYKEQIKFDGDPTEGALLIAGQKFGVKKESLERYYEKCHEIPFDSKRKWMASTYATPENNKFCFVKGALEEIIKKCSKIRIEGNEYSIKEKHIKKILHEEQKLTQNAYRVLALAYVKEPEIDKDNLEINTGLCFSGLVGLFDPPRPEAKKAVNLCKQAGIKPVMITGDHKNTALSIAKELNIAASDNEVMTGDDLNNTDDSELERKVNKTKIFARVTPKHKLRIIKAYKKAGQIVAMTGDGVNDAPAVKEADIGIAMGLTGTDVTREASDLVLRDDNFATITAAIKEGRAIYDNIRKFIRYLLSCNIGEILTMLITTSAGFPLPLIPIQILWINLVTDGLPALALGLEKGEADIMNRPPREPDESVFSKGLAGKMIVQGIFIALSTVGVFMYILYTSGGNLKYAQTMAFTTLVTAQLIFVFCCRSEQKTIFEINPVGNLYLLSAVILSFVMQSAVLYLPMFQTIFKTVPLQFYDWLIAISASFWPIIILGILGLIKKRIKSRMYFIRISTEAKNYNDQM